MTRIFHMLCLMALPASAYAIGTLFYAPDERKNHDETTHVYTINGIVQRAAGKSMVWINGRPVWQDDPMFPGLKVFRDHVLFDGLIIKAGESKDTASVPPQMQSPP